jgi:2-dehydro-3-deoxyphosphogluconate aldolase/(4S)-4-hydroxy-2-oxoglutarate aldolase
MIRKYTVLDQLHQGRIVAVVRGKSAEDAIEISNACISGGIKSIELAFTTPNCLQAFQELTKKARGTLIGAGTVLDAETARLSILYGASFIVSPNFSKEISEVCNLYSIPYLPGCFTVTEITEALKQGVDVVKVFPGHVVGAGFISSIKGPLPNVNLMPTGGVNLENINHWFDKGAFAVGVGGELTKGLLGENYEQVEKNARQFVSKVSAYTTC